MIPKNEGSTGGFMTSGRTDGFRTPPQLNRREQMQKLSKDTVEQVNAMLADHTRHIATGTAKSLDHLRREFMISLRQFSHDLAELHYFRRATEELLPGAGISKEDIADQIETLKIADFDADVERDVAGLNATVSEAPVKRGDLVVFTSNSVYGDTMITEDGKQIPNSMAGKEFAPYTVKRAKVLIGDQANMFRPVFQEGLIGIEPGQSKEFSYQITPNVSVRSTVTVLAAYSVPQPQEAPAESATPKSDKDGVRATDRADHESLPADQRVMSDVDFNQITGG